MTPEAAVLAAVKRAAKAHSFVPLRVSLRPGVEVGWMDTFVFGPAGSVALLETKRLGQPLTPIQDHRRAVVEGLGHFWRKPESDQAVEDALREFADYCRTRERALHAR